jgi:predicted transcriptional regulator YdeE
MERVMHEGFTAIGLTAEVRNDNPSTIGGLWERFYQTDILAVLPKGTDRRVHCIYHGYTGNHLDPFKMTIGYVVSRDAECPDGLEVVRVPPQPVIIFEAKGIQPATLVGCWQTIWQTDIDRAFVADFDIYDPNQPDCVTVMVGISASE